MNIKQWIKSWIDKWMKDAKAKIPMPDAKPTTTDKPTDSKCNCDLSKPTALPSAYNDAMLNAGGNAYECPTIAGRDIRLALIKPDGNIWLLGNLLSRAIVSASPVICQCFDADGDRYHFVGYSYNADKQEDIIKAKAGDSFEYRTTTFVWYEFRRT